MHKLANRYLRAIVFGGNCHLAMLSGSCLIRVVTKLLRAREIRWPDRNLLGNPLATLHQWFTRHGYTVHEPWIWKSAHASFTVDLRRMAVKTAQHAARQGWRWHLWGRLLECGRHECDELRNATVDEFARIDFTKVRSYAKEPSFRAVCTGAMLSPAAMQDRQDFPVSCPLCGQFGHWHHCLWQCVQRPTQASAPDSPIALRFGWGATPAQVAWLTEAAKAIWQSRYHVDLVADS